MITIEPFRPEFTNDLYSIALATGDSGSDGAHLYADADLIGHIYAGAYAALEPSLVLLAIDDKGVAGYVLGATETPSWENRLEREWWPKLRVKYPDPGDRPSPGWTQDLCCMYMIHHPARVPSAVSGPYPAHLHMNLLPRARRAGVGSRLLDAWLELIAPLSPPGVHVGVAPNNERGTRFWSRSGFRQLKLPAAQADNHTLWMGQKLPRQPRKSAEFKDLAEHARRDEG